MKNPLTLSNSKTNISIVFHKLSDSEWYELQKKYVPIYEDWDFLMFLDFHHYKKSNFNLAKMYVALFSVFGDHNGYDDYKSSFSYRFKLSIKKQDKTYTYGLNMHEMKGNMPYFSYYREPREGESVNTYQNPINEEFSKEDMRHCTLMLIAYLEGFFISYKTYFNQPFYRINRAGYLIYGYDKDDFFVNQYPYENDEDYEHFQKEIERFKNIKHLQTDMSKGSWGSDNKE